MDLESHKFISFFDPEQAEQLCRAAIVENFTHETVIFEEGEISDCLYLILEGQVAVRKRVGFNQYQTLTKAGPNAFFGEMGLLDGKPRSAGALAGKGTTLAKIPAASLMEILDTIKGTKAIKIFSYMTQRLRESTEEYVKQVIHKEKMVLLGEMLNSIVHDFQSPLSSINLASGMIKEQHPDDDTVEWCDLIKTQAKRMSDMATEFLEFTRGNAALQKHPINLATIFQHFERLNRVYLNQANVEFSIHCPDELVMDADENKLIRVFQNLVGNAVEAFRNRGGSIEIYAMVKGEKVKITICDNGPGIPEGIRDRLFEPFVTYGKGGGTGLGTAIAKSIIDAHGGSISFDSSAEKGTKFYIDFPLSVKTCC